MKDPALRWKVSAALLVIPFTAVLHHLVFFRGMCMLNKIGDDYTPSVIALWLSRDPSLPVACVLALVLWFAGRKWVWIQDLAIPAIVAGIPLSLWIWDIPLTGRFICDSFHDGRLRLSDGTVVTTKWMYLLSAFLYVLLLGRSWITRGRHRPNS